MTTAALLSAYVVPSHAASLTLHDIEQSYAKDAILELLEQGIIQGNGNGKFDPAGSIQRQDMAVILAKALQLDTSSKPSTPTFTDVSVNHYAYAYVEAAVKAGLVKGIGEGEFGTGQNLTRQDMAVLFVRALDGHVAGNGSALKFSDTASISNYAKDAVAAAVELRLMNGVGNGMFNPTGPADRQSVALVTSRFLTVKEQLDSPSEPQAPATPSPDEDSPAPSEEFVPNPASFTGPSTGGGASAPSGPITNPPGSPDTSAPVIRLLSSSSLSVGESIAVTSSEAGLVYVVPYSLNATTKTQLESAVTGNMAIKSTAAAQVETRIATANLPAGEYKVYAVDTAGNVSSPTGKITLADKLMNSPVMHFSSGQTLVITYDEMLNPLFVPDAHELSVSTRDGALRLVKEIDHIHITGQSVIVTLVDPIRMASPVEVQYTPSSADATIRSAAGSLSPAFGPRDIQYLPDDVRGQLQSLISEAKALHDNAIAGNTAGTYPSFSFQQLHQAILDAQSIADDVNVSASQLAIAYNHLTLHMEAFKNSRIKPLTVSLTSEDTAFVLNSNVMRVHGMLARIVEPSSDEDRYSMRSIANIIRVHRVHHHSEPEYQYNATDHWFDIRLDGEIIGHIEIESSNTALVELSERSDGIDVAPAPNAIQDSPVFLIFKVVEEGSETGRVNVPIRFDAEPPTVTQVTYDGTQGRFTLHSSELIYSYSQTVPLSPQVDYSGNGDFSANSIDILPLILTEDFWIEIAPDRRSVVIQLTPLGIGKLSAELPGGKFKILIHGMSDFAMNWKQEIHIVDAQ